MNWILFLTVLVAVESGGRLDAVGDRNLVNRAYGPCQIRSCYLKDVNRIAGTSYSIDEVRRSETLSRWCVITYVRHYGERYERLTGEKLTMEVAARIHNGGPNGWKRRTTDAYWKRFWLVLSAGEIS